MRQFDMDGTFNNNASPEKAEGVVHTSQESVNEEALSESEERLRLLIETAEDYAIFTMTTDSLVNYWNAGAERIFGYSEEEIIGQSCAVLFTPEDRENGVPELEMRTAEEKGSAADERWHITRNGTRFYCSGVIRSLRHGGVLHGFAKIARDLTGQKRVEEELQRAYDELDERVRNRTAELLDLNQTLLAEVGERRAAEERTRKLVQQIVTVQEVERANIARDLHDHLGQQLTGLRLKLQNHKASCGDGGQLSVEVDELQAIAEQLDGDLDFLAWKVRPAGLDEFGLPVTLANYVQSGQSISTRQRSSTRRCWMSCCCGQRWRLTFTASLRKP